MNTSRLGRNYGDRHVIAAGKKPDERLIKKIKFRGGMVPTMAQNRVVKVPALMLSSILGRVAITISRTIAVTAATCTSEEPVR
jgi:hypothetical protein